MGQIYRYPSSTQVTVAAVGTNDDPIPGSSILIAGKDPSGLLVPVSVDADGEVDVNVGALPLPPGAATEAKQDDQIVLATDANTLLTTISTIDYATETTLSALAAVDFATQTTLQNISEQLPANLGQLPMADSLAVVIASDQSPIDVEVASLPLPSGASTLAEQQAQTALLTTIDADTGSIDSKLGTLGQKAMAGSAPVVIASDQSTLPVSAASLPLPSGAATEATLSALNAKVVTVDTGAVVVASSALPTGAATETTLAALDTKVPSQGQALMAASLPVVIASNQSAIPVSSSAPSGRAKANAPTVNDYTSVPVTSAAYVQLIASTTSTANLVEIFDSSGVALYLAVGGAGVEVDQFVVTPGGNGQVPLAIPSGSRVSVKAVSTSATVGFIVVNLYT